MYDRIEYYINQNMLKTLSVPARYLTTICPTYMFHEGRVWRHKEGARYILSQNVARDGDDETTSGEITNLDDDYF